MTHSPDPCRQCGACCDHPEPWSIVELTLEDMARIPPGMTVSSFGSWRKMARTGNRCVALTGTVGVDARCSIYDIRPQICREYDPAARIGECNMCRAGHGLHMLCRAHAEGLQDGTPASNQPAPE
jgi:Fe-S-cluster containining protein